MGPANFSFKYKDAERRQRNVLLGGSPEVIHHHLKRPRVSSVAQRAEVAWAADGRGETLGK
eukprot:8809066-Alexandrium_andersonii.AAC.1